MKEFEAIRKDIKNKKFAPIYFLYGDEPYFIDALTEDLLNHVLKDEEKAFNEHIFYGNEVQMKEIILLARQFPMMSDYQLIIVKEAQHLNKMLNDLISYAMDPLESTILVFNYKFAKPDGRNKAIKKIKEKYVLAESSKLYENKIAPYIGRLVKSMGFSIEENAQYLLAENIGQDLSRIHNEINKLTILLKTEKHITADLVDKHIGISKEYNNFELTKSIAEADIKRSFEIIHYFGKNPKNNSIFSTLAVMFRFFSNLMIYITMKNENPTKIASKLKISPYFLKEYQVAAKNFQLRKITKIIGYLRETDMKAKGVGASGSVSEEELMRELLYKIYRL